jgi:hypothetical protein
VQDPLDLEDLEISRRILVLCHASGSPVADPRLLRVPAGPPRTGKHPATG